MHIHERGRTRGGCRVWITNGPRYGMAKCPVHEPRPYIRCTILFTRIELYSEFLYPATRIARMTHFTFDKILSFYLFSVYDYTSDKILTHIPCGDQFQSFFFFFIIILKQWGKDYNCVIPKWPIFKNSLHTTRREDVWVQKVKGLNFTRLGSKNDDFTRFIRIMKYRPAHKFSGKNIANQYFEKPLDNRIQLL